MGTAVLSLPNLYELIRVDNVRSHPRFVMERPLEGDLHGEGVQVCDLSIGGFGLLHAAQLRVGSKVRFLVRDTEFGETIPFNLTVMWSQMSGGRNEKGQSLYHSGLRINDDLEQIGGKLGRLLRYYGKPESISMETKKISALAKLMKRVSAERKLVISLEPSELLLSYQALDAVSRMDPGEVQTLSHQAAEALAASKRPDGWSRDVLAAWKLGDGAVQPATIDTARRILGEIDRYVQEHR